MTDDKWPYWVVVVAFLILGFIAGITIPLNAITIKERSIRMAYVRAQVGH